ncbi:hypothetical protein C8J57DRAFT_1323259 [Mycena rebaudengoi]|nr:hypothetical protein C8J57DRAFT_1323259 [Mycena rebaudengoi]
MNTPRGVCPNCRVPLASQSTSAPVPELEPPDSKEISRVILDSNHRARLDAEIATLTLERDDVDNQIHGYDGALSFLRRLPMELLSLIFSFCTLHDKETVWTLSQVCNRWREVLITQPLFWVDVAVDLDRLHTDVDADSEFRLRTQLQRSGQLPLNISLFLAEPYGERENTFVQILLEHCSRWETATVEGPEDLFSGLACIRGRLPLLKKLKIEVGGGDIPARLDMFEIAPNLQQVSVNKDFCTVSCAARFPFSQLRGYVGTNSWNGHLETLRAASNLVELSLNGDHLAHPENLPISLPHLLRLFITENAFLGCLETPQLRELFCSAMNPQHLRRFVERISSQLQKLVIWDPVSPQDLVPILDAVKTLAVMGIAVSPADADAVLALLTMDHEGLDKVPALEYIAIAFYHSESSGLCDLFLDMVRSKWQKTHTFRRASAYTFSGETSSFSTESSDQMEVLRTQGLEIFAHRGYYQMPWDLIPHNLLVQE